MTQGTKYMDRIVDQEQIQWMFATARECPDEVTENEWIKRNFRVPHVATPSDNSFVDPVIVYRTSRRVLLYQRSGVVI